jgi:acyl-CoA synthetase (NDP forming)
LDVAVDALFDQAGVVRVTTLEELFDVTALFANQPIPRGRRVGIVTNAGGPAILAVDALESQGLEIPEFSDELKSELQSFLSEDASVTNPIDMIAAAGPQEYRKSLSCLLKSDEIDTVIAIFIPASEAGVGETAIAIREAAEDAEGSKTFLSVYMASSGAPSELAGGRVQFPVFAFPERAAKALRKAVDYAEWLDRPTGASVDFDDIDPATARSVVERAVEDIGEESAWLEPDDVDAVLSSYGMTIPKAVMVGSADDAVAFAADLGQPIVLKVVAPSAVHKSDVGGVALDLVTPDEVRTAFARVVGSVPDPEGVLAQEYVDGGHEVLIGMVEDPNFGPLIGFGLGGVFVELIGDVTFRIHPLTDLDAKEMISEVKSGKLLEGYRGGEEGDIAAVEDTLLRLSALIEDLPEVTEIDLNPVKVARPGDGVRIVDARIRVRRVGTRWIPSRTDLPMRL